MQVPDHLVAEIIDGELMARDASTARERCASTPATACVTCGSSIRSYARWRSIAWKDGRGVVISTHGGDETVRAEPFDAIEIAIDRWWT